MSGEVGLDAAAAATPRGRRRRRLLRLLVALLLLAVAALVGLWLVRKPIAESVVRRELERRGVQARYRIEDLNLGRQRLTNVVIGDPARPDLVADWIELSTHVGWDGGASVLAARAGRVRMRGTLRDDGTVSFGQIDRLLPPPSGKPFTLPRLDVVLEDGGLRLDTPFGAVGMTLKGRGRLDDGFAGQLAAVAPQLALPGCRIGEASAAVAIAITEQRPQVRGPVRMARAQCGGASLEEFAGRIDATLNERFNRWRGHARLRIGELAASGARATRIGGSVSFEGGAARTLGAIDLAGGDFSGGGVAGRRLAVAGNYHAGRQNGFDGTVSAGAASVSRARQQQLAALGGTAAGTPVGPLAEALATASVRAARRFDLSAALRAGTDGVAVSRLRMRAASGAEMLLAGRPGVSVTLPGGGVQLGGLLTTGGGGLPEMAVQLAQAAPGAPVTGTAVVQPYAAGGARLALETVRFSAAAGGATQVSSIATLTGPLADGRVERLRLPIDARWNGAGRLAVNPGCTPVGWQRLSISSLDLSAGGMRLCPDGAALVRIDGGSVSGGARLGATRLAGRLGGTPLTLGFADGRYALGSNAFALTGVAARLGEGTVSRLDLDRIDGQVAGGGAAGRFAGAAGQIGNVPLLIGEGVGDWRFAGGALRLNGAVGVRDAAAERRFEPVASRDVALTLADNRITVTGTLTHPATGVKVADARIAHDLRDGRGGADLLVPGITFGENFQPDALTPLTFGVIADVKGQVSGRGRIDWSGEGVTSTGTFRTDGTDLAAAFGPVTGLSGEIRFTDLLGLVSAPDQVARVAEVNPGIPVRDGTVRYRLLPGQRIAVDGGRWPLAGGEMVLEPTVLDFGADRVRRLTFRVSGVQGGLFLQEFDFENLNTTGAFDGVLPMIFDDLGGRVEGGRLVARAGGGNIAYVGEVTKEDVGFWGNLAFQALRSLDYQNLTIELDGPLAGEMVTAIRFEGVSQGEGAKSNFLIRRLARLPFVFNVRIRAPFRQLIDSVQSYYDPSRLIERNLPALLEEQRRRESGAPAPVQPPESEKRP